MSDTAATAKRARFRLMAMMMGGVLLAMLVLVGVAVYLATTGGGTLRLRTTPGHVDVEVDGAWAGTTADTGLVLAFDRVDTMTVVLSREGYEPDTNRVLVRRDELVMLDVVLMRPGMRYVRGGRFTMGDDDGDPDERPARDTTVGPFYIDETEVTVAAFRAFAPDHVPAFPGDRMPATGVTRARAEAFCRAVGKRLPTEAEWERACRGVQGWTYAYGDQHDASRVRGGEPAGAGPAEVASYRPGNAGVFDMTGNVWEWCAGGERALTDTVRAGALRGGAWYSGARDLRCANRGEPSHERNPAAYGFRCVADL